MQLGFIKSFINDEIRIQVISIESHGMRKFNNKPIIIKDKKKVIDKIMYNYLSYINIPIIKQINIYYNLLKKLKEIKINKNIVLISYNTMSIFALPVLKIAKKEIAKV
ncbi:hypothetical protein [Thomasclavelia cocleata]|uniref:hypothetical protein n=1 Tax=Thomasclavelia cocleata TaxID=69824 RepID=UPI00242D11D8|nr:hypothetical protein [Thomasclavelia cocleata]